MFFYVFKIFLIGQNGGSPQKNLTTGVTVGPQWGSPRRSPSGSPRVSQQWFVWHQPRDGDLQVAN